jgi:hypothetical protein
MSIERGTDWRKEQAAASVASFQAAVIDAAVREVDVPTGRKDVSVAYQKDGAFEAESGAAIGVYYEPNRMDATVVHIDWEQGGRTSVPMDSVESLEEGDY